jgi:hypothetical protein
MIKPACALFVVLLPLAAPAIARDDCMSGVSCHEMAEASVSFGIVRDCPANFVIKPDLQARYDDIIQALKSTAGQKGTPPLSAKRQTVAPGLCDNVARKILKGKTNIQFLAVKPEAASRLMPGVN